MSTWVEPNRSGVTITRNGIQYWYRHTMDGANVGRPGIVRVWEAVNGTRLTIQVKS